MSTISRAVRWNVSPCMLGDDRLPSTARSVPWLRRMRASRLTSARFGTFFNVTRSDVSRLAIISGSAAFFAPEIGMMPFSCPPPTILMRSMRRGLVLSEGRWMQAAKKPAWDGELAKCCRVISLGAVAPLRKRYVRSMLTAQQGQSMRLLPAAGLPFVSAGASVIRAFSFRFRKLALSSSASREARAAAAAWACVGFSPVSVMASLNQKRCETPSA